MGEVVSRPEPQHHRNPGVRYEPTSDDSLVPGVHYAVIPTPWEFPAGTVWACECGRTFVSVGPRYPNSPGDCGWRREGLRARWWRTWMRQTD